MENLTMQEVIELDGKVLTLEEMEELECNENISEWYTCGNSGIHVNKTWYAYVTTEGKEINLYN